MNFLLKKDVNHLHPFITPTIIGVSVYFFGWGFSDPFFSVYLSHFAGHYTMIGFLNTLYVVLAIVNLIPLGALLNTTNHHAIANLAKVGYAICGLLYFLAGHYQSLPILIFALLFNGLLLPMVRTTAAATLRTFSTKKNASFAFGLFYGGTHTVWAIGTLLSVTVIDSIPVHFLFLPVILFSLLAVLPTIHLLPTHSLSIWQGIRTLRLRSLCTGTIRDLKQFHREMWWMYGIFFVCASIQLFWWTYIPLYAQQIQFPLSRIGLLVAIITLPFIFSFFTSAIADHSERLRVMMVGFFLTGISIAALALMPMSFASLAISGVISMFGYALILPAASSVITVLSPTKVKGTASAFVDMTLYTGILVTSPILGRMVDVFGWISSFLLIGIALVAVGVFIFVLKFRWQKMNLLYHVNHPKARKLPYSL